MPDPRAHALGYPISPFQGSSEVGDTAMVATVYDPSQIDYEKPGKHHYQVAFHLDSNWGYSLVPMTVINGLRGAAEPGVAAIGGTHGNEYEGQVAVKRLCGDLNPEEMRGRVLL